VRVANVVLENQAGSPTGLLAAAAAELHKVDVSDLGDA